MLALVLSVRAETHTIHFDNQRGFGTPTLVSNGVVLSTGADVTVNGPIEAPADRFAAVLIVSPLGSCGINGENCTTVDISLTNAIPGEPGGSASSAAIDLVPPHAFSAVTGFGYYNGCDGAGEDCANANCIAALPGPPPKTIVPVLCQTDDVNIAIVFCD
ncbi:glycopeptide [Ganoderma leucocontextum]|nr:glycopeptide [Ganoderma leucocontextum]